MCASLGLSAQTGGNNQVKVNLSSFFLKGANIQYERAIAKRITVALGYSAIPKSDLAFKSVIENMIDNPDIKVGQFKLGTSIITPELRYYLGKEGAFHGLYFAPYVRLGNYQLEGPVSYTTSTGAMRTAVFDGKLTALTGGLMAGSSWRLSNKLYLDWWIIGASYGGADGDLIAATPLNSDEQEALRQELNNIEILGTTISSQVDANGARVQTKGSMVGFRGLGINLGLRL